LSVHFYLGYDFSLAITRYQVSRLCLEITCLSFFLVRPVYWYLWYELLCHSGVGWLPCCSAAQVQVPCWHPAQGDQRRRHEVVPGEVRGCHPQQGPRKHLVIVDSHQMICPSVLQFKFNLCTMNEVYVWIPNALPVLPLLELTLCP